MKTLFTLIAAVLFASSIFAQEDSNSKKLGAMIEDGMKTWQTPGLAATVVKNGEVVFKKTYGVKEMESGEPVDGNTLFSMASTTKALIAISLGMLVDQGKINGMKRLLNIYLHLSFQIHT